MIYEHQKEAYHKTFIAVRAFALSLELNNPFTPRFSPLLIGPTGSGKSHVARAVAKNIGYPFLVLNANSWIVRGAKEKTTWSVIVDWVKAQNHAQPLIIIIDEIDKATGNTDWNHHVQQELFELLDKQIPPQLLDDGEEILTEEDDLETAFKRVFFVGVGAFQDLQEKPPSVGFKSVSDDLGSLSTLTRTLPRELVNRFSSVHVIRGLERAEYESMAETAAKGMPKELRPFFIEKCKKRIEQAIADKHGARFIEIAYADMLIDTAEALEEADEMWAVPEL